MSQLAQPTRPSLLERERELATLARVIEAAAEGRGAVVVVEGAAGVGKTRLLDAARDTAVASGLRVLRARASVLESAFPFGVVRQIFEPALVQAHERETLYAGAAAHARPVVDPAAATTAATDDAFVLLHGLYWLTVNLSERSPLLLVVDDVQWSDAVSLQFLSYLARRLEELPVGLLVGRRTGEPVVAEVDFDAVAELASERVEPALLSPAAVAELLEEAFGVAPEAGFVEACHHATGGNPLLLRELSRALLASARRRRPRRSH